LRPSTLWVEGDGPDARSELRGADGAYRREQGRAVPGDRGVKADSDGQRASDRGPATGSQRC
jgi:hypothetical protein